MPGFQGEILSSVQIILFSVRMLSIKYSWGHLLISAFKVNWVPEGNFRILYDEGEAHRDMPKKTIQTATLLCISVSLLREIFPFRVGCGRLTLKAGFPQTLVNSVREVFPHTAFPVSFSRRPSHCWFVCAILLQALPGFNGVTAFRQSPHLPCTPQE